MGHHHRKLNVVVAIIDTGVDYTHSDLAANIWTNPGEVGLDSTGHDKRANGIDDDQDGFVDDVHGYDFHNNDGDPMDDSGHGTHVAGTIGAVGNNNLGVTGVSWTTSIMPLKFLDQNNRGSTADAIRAINYATMMRTSHAANVRILNNSWGQLEASARTYIWPFKPARPRTYYSWQPPATATCWAEGLTPICNRSTRPLTT